VVIAETFIDMFTLIINIEREKLRLKQDLMQLDLCLQKTLSAPIMYKWRVFMNGLYKNQLNFIENKIKSI